jgi:methylenetetrahydrofolate dehydrogenase (NADP+)/methenyltetrahydrofolate cyclohydrolase
VVVGRSTVVGKPVALLLLAADATVTVCHSRTAGLAAALCREADVLVAAAGQARPDRSRRTWPPAPWSSTWASPRRPAGVMAGDVDEAA